MVKIDIMLIGNSGSGKTSLVNRFLKTGNSNQQNKDEQEESKDDGNFKNNEMPTLGVNMEKKTIQIGEQQLKICIWDTAGQEKFFALTKQYFQKADGIIIVFDITDLESYKKIEDYWIQQVKDKSEENVNKILIGNKIDIGEDREVDTIMAQKLAEHYDMNYYECSAKTGESVKEAFEYLAKVCMGNIQKNQKDTMNNGNGANQTQNQQQNGKQGQNNKNQFEIIPPKNNTKKNCFDKFKDIFQMYFQKKEEEQKKN